MITDTMVGVPDYKYSIMGPRKPILIVKAPKVHLKASPSNLNQLPGVEGFRGLGFGV